MADTGSRFRHSILAAQRSGHRVLAELIRPLGLTPAWAEVLTVLDQHGPLTIRQLGGYLICEADHPSRLVSRIEQKGLISRKVNRADRRAFLLSLTPAGETAAKAVLEAETRLDAWIAKQLSEEDLQTISDRLSNLLKNTTEGTSLKNRFGD